MTKSILSTIFCANSATIVKGVAKRASLYALLFLVLFSCSKEPLEPVEPDSKDSSISELVFEASTNSELFMNTTGYMGGEVIYVTVPDGASLTNLVPTFKVDEGATLIINDKEIENGVTAIDFTECKQVTVVAEAGNKSKYFICVKNGLKSIDDLVYKFMVKYSIPGISVTFGGENGNLYSSGYGFANKFTHVKVTPKHLFRLASVSKQQTALAIMTLYEQGKLDVEDKVFGTGGLLEEEFGSNITAEAAQVTVRHLLEHTSGWISNPDPLFTSNSAYDNKPLVDRVKYVLANVKHTHAPGTQYSYYNLGYGILGLIIEKFSGKDYETFLHEDVHAKAGITDIHVGGGQDERRDNEVVYYSQSGTNGYGNDMEVIKAAGGIIASTDELVKLMCTIDYGTKVPDILKKETLDLMYTPSKAYFRYGLGWRMNHSIYTNWASYHTGNLAGTASVWKRGADGVHGAILCNSRSYIDGFDTALIVLLGAIDDRV